MATERYHDVTGNDIYGDGGAIMPELSSNRPTDQQLHDLGAAIIRDALGEADAEPLPWPDDEGFFWARMPCGRVTACRATRPPGGALGVQIIGSMFWFPQQHPTVRGWRFWRLPIPEYVR